MSSIFIQGVSRTGSKFYMQLLNTNNDIFISPELMFRHPIKRDLYSLVVSSMEANESLDGLADRLLAFKERKPYERTISKIGRPKLVAGLKGLESVSPESVFDLIIRLSAEVEGKAVYGAKFAAHYSYTSQMMRYFGDSRFLYLTRDPRAIFVSDQRKKTKESKGRFYRFPVKGAFLRASVLCYTVLEWWGCMREFEKCTRIYGNDRVRLFRYEDLISNEDLMVETVSEFLGFSPSSLSLDRISIVDSSFNGGVSSSRWKADIRGYEKLLIELFLGRMMKRYGYR